MKNEKLEVGDKIYFAKRNNYYKTVNYIFETVERLTPTQAILGNGAKLKNQASKDWLGNIQFIELGNRDSWYLVTQQVLEDAEKKSIRQKVNSWFSKQQFTDEQKQQIYNLFKTPE